MFAILQGSHWSPTGVLCCSDMIRTPSPLPAWSCLRCSFSTSSGVGGGVVAQDYFKTHFGIEHAGVTDTKKSNDVSSNVVSVLQAGAFFGALGSAPLSGKRFFPVSPSSVGHARMPAASQEVSKKFIGLHSPSS